MVHVSYSHLWDEVNAKFRLNRKRKYKVSSMSVGVQTIVQRGTMMVAMADLDAGRQNHFPE